MTALEIDTAVEHFACKIFRQAAKDLGMPEIVLPATDAERLNRASYQLKQVLAPFAQVSQPKSH